MTLWPQPCVDRIKELQQQVTRVREAAQWVRRNYPALKQLHSRLDAALDQPAHNAGPSIREAADADRRWWGGEKIGE